jgi:lycopene beta-cyclase
VLRTQVVAVPALTSNVRQPAARGHGDDFEVVLVGGGLQNGLLALGLLRQDPRRSLALVEQQSLIGGNHTWCLHALDVPEAARALVEPLIDRRWAGYEVRFPDRARRLGGGYAAIRSERFAEVVGSALAGAPHARVLLGRKARTLGADTVTLDDGTCLRAKLVIDARGPDASVFAGHAGYQKFVGLELELDRPHELPCPLLMDARIEQHDGFRFMYALPFDRTRVLLEDTRFSLGPELDEGSARAAVLEYAARFARGVSVLREERGVLPMPWSSPARPAPASPFAAGYRGGFFHPATGYSLPAALRLACHFATRDPAAAFDAAFARLLRAHRAQVRYFERLNWLLFRGFPPAQMWRVFSRFYALPEALIQRFYAMALTPLDRARVLIGRPPRGLSLSAALAGRPA